MIPRRFFWFLDLLALGMAFEAAYVLFPAFKSLLVLEPGGVLPLPWAVQLFSPAAMGGQLQPPQHFLWVFFTVAITALLMLAAAGNHDPLLSQSRTRVVVGGFLAPLAGLASVSTVLYAFNNLEWSRLFLFQFASFSGLALIFYRLALRHYFLHRQAGQRYARNLVLVGTAAGVGWALRHLSANVQLADYQVIGYLQLPPTQAECPVSPVGIQGAQGPVDLPDCLGGVEVLGDLLVRYPIHELLVIYPLSGGEWLQQVIRDCDYFGVVLRLVPEALLFREWTDMQTLYRTEPLHLPAIVLAPPRFDFEALFFKRILDILVSGTLLVLLAPLFGLIALATKLTTPNLPVFYPWRVVGQNGVGFTGYKFTTMFADAEEREGELQQRNEMSGPVFKIKDDPRVTTLGRCLRKYSLNELPQLWSVLKGDMSLVGPRPAFPHELARYNLWHKRKLSIRPGITCLWQVRGRNRINDFDEWVKMDLEYIDNWSLWLDFKILVRTALAVVRGTGW